MNYYRILWYVLVSNSNPQPGHREDKRRLLQWVRDFLMMPTLHAQVPKTMIVSHTVLYYTILYYTILYYFILYYTRVFCVVLYSLPRAILDCLKLCYDGLYHIYRYTVKSSHILYGIIPTPKCLGFRVVEPTLVPMQARIPNPPSTLYPLTHKPNTMQFVWWLLEWEALVVSVALSIFILA